MPYLRLPADHRADILLTGAESVWQCIVSELSLGVVQGPDDVDFLAIDDSVDVNVGGQDEGAVIDEVLALLDGSTQEEVNEALKLLPSAPVADGDGSGSDGSDSDDGEAVAPDQDLDDLSLAPNTDEERAMLQDLGLILITKAGGSSWNVYARRVGDQVVTLGHIESLVSSSGISLKAVCHKHTDCVCLIRATSKYFLKYRAVLQFLSQGSLVCHEEHLQLSRQLRDEFR